MAALACLAEYPAKLKGLFESKHITEVTGIDGCRAKESIFTALDFEHHLQISVGNYIPNSWVMFISDIYQPLLSLAYQVSMSLLLKVTSYILKLKICSIILKR